MPRVIVKTLKELPRCTQCTRDYKCIQELPLKEAILTLFKRLKTTCPDCKRNPKTGRIVYRCYHCTFWASMFDITEEEIG